MNNISLLDLLRLSQKKNENEVSDFLDYFVCEESVEAALNFLDNHPDCTLEEYEEWLTHRGEAIKTMNENKESYGN